MSQTEVGAYILLLCQQWNRGSIPTKQDRLALLAKGKVSNHVLSKFNQGDDGQLRNNRMELVRKSLAEFKESKSTAGKNGAAKRWHSHSTAIAQPTLNHGSPTASPITNDSSPVSSLQSPEDPLPPPGDEKSVTGNPVTEPTPEALPVPKRPKEPLQLRAEKLMRRQLETPLTAGEQRAFKKNKVCIEATSETDWLALEAFYTAPQDQTFARKDLAALVNNWNGEIDRARLWKPGAIGVADRAQKMAELARATRELTALGKLPDHTEGSRSYNRFKELRPAVENLRKELGVIA